MVWLDIYFGVHWQTKFWFAAKEHYLQVERSRYWVNSEKNQSGILYLSLYMMGPNQVYPGPFV